MNIELSIVIVNYNGLQFLENCFNSLQEFAKDIKHEIIVLDNNSTDDSLNFIKENYPTIQLIESKKNAGFGIGNNQGVAAAKGEYILLINNDTIVLNPLKPIVDHLKSDQSIGVIGIKMADKNQGYLQSAGNFPNLFNMFQLKKLLDLETDFKSGNFSKKQYEVDWMAGSFLMLSKKVYQQIGGFDSDYFMYVEDVDFCKKIANLGLKRIFFSEASYIHFVGFNPKKNLMLVKGYQIYIKKHCSGVYKQLLLGVLQINRSVKKLKLIFNRI